MNRRKSLRYIFTVGKNAKMQTNRGSVSSSLVAYVTKRDAENKILQLLKLKMKLSFTN